MDSWVRNPGRQDLKNSVLKTDILWFICLCNFLGYLLDPNGEKCVTAPRQVSALHHKDITLSLVAASDGATVCVTTKGDIYLLADYQCKKLASKYVYFCERNIP